ncbi:neuron navigator 3-like protein [Labeo rohita]|uniref:Neuron navigator 3-like protein n=1 Tax=Labeo rohita TaxID=84645 RepID=A0A498LGE1_LABRO|nr:neuron navigator 3-like protein [Labeo rohita]
MASSAKSKKSRAPSRHCPGGCGITIAARNPLALCPACLGPEHAQAALQAPIPCNQCSKLSPGVLRRRAVFMQDVCDDNVQGGDTTASPQVMESPRPMLSWADQLIPSVSGDMSEDEEEKDEDPFASQMSPGYQLGVDVGRREASRLGIDWPSALPAAKCLRLDGKFHVPTT